MLHARASLLLIIALAACNAPPGQPQIAINPGQPDTLADLQVLFLADTPDDNEKDLVSHSFQWFEDGSLRTDLTTDTVLAAETDKGETWKVVVTPNDGNVDGEIAEAEVTIGDAPPSLTLILQPVAPYTNDDLVALATGDDADGDDISFRYTWTRDGAPQEIDGFTVPAALTAHGETWEVTVTPVSDDLEGESVSATVVIGNTPPTLDAVQLIPVAPTVADVVQAVPALPEDLDGDTVSLTYDWTVNGALVQSGPSDLLDASQFQKHDQVQVTATPDDGLALGAPVQSELVEVQNALPTASNVIVSPSPLQEGNVATCSPTGFADIDGDPEGWRFTWTVDGVVVGDLSTLGSTAFFKGQSVVCTVQPDDGESLGAPLESAPVEVVNTPPVLTTVALSTLTPSENDTLTGSLGAASDADGDPITYGYEWFVNGASVSFATSLPSSRYKRGDQISLLVTPFDGEEFGEPVASATAVAVNTPPSLTAVTIAPAELFTQTVAVATPLGVDLDGDAITYSYDWFVDGIPRGSALSPSLAGASFFDKDQSVYVVVTPFDGVDYGQPLQSPVEIVLNTPPTAPVVTILPTAPEPADTLTCVVTTPSTDSDGDPITYAFGWEVDGRPYEAAADGATSSVVNGSVVGEASSWICEAFADDGEASSPLATDEVDITTPGCVFPELDISDYTGLAPGAPTITPSSFGISTQGLVQASGTVYADVSDPTVPALYSARVGFELYDVNTNYLCAVYYDASTAVPVDVDTLTPRDPSTGAIGGILYGAFQLSLSNGTTDCSRVSAATFGTTDIRDYFDQFTMYIGFGALQDLLSEAAPIDLANNVVHSQYLGFDPAYVWELNLGQALETAPCRTLDPSYGLVTAPTSAPLPDGAYVTSDMIYKFSF